MTVYLDLTREFNAGRFRAVICSGQAARRMTDPRDRLLYSRSAGDLIELASSHADLIRELAKQRPLLLHVGSDRRALAEALQLEMLDLMEVAERRLSAYRAAAGVWSSRWLSLNRELAHLPLQEAHARMVAAAVGVLPEKVQA
jgi:hypothetical protein